MAFLLCVGFSVYGALQRLVYYVPAPLNAALALFNSSMEEEVSMKEFLRCTFGGLKTSYLIRQYIFGVLIAACYFNAATSNGQVLSLGTMAMFAINTLLYPYSRFVYESIVEFVLG